MSESVCLCARAREQAKIQDIRRITATVANRRPPLPIPYHDVLPNVAARLLRTQVVLHIHEIIVDGAWQSLHDGEKEGRGKGCVSLASAAANFPSSTHFFFFHRHPSLPSTHPAGNSSDNKALPPQVANHPSGLNTTATVTQTSMERRV